MNIISPLDQVARTYTRVYKHKTFTETGNEEKTTAEGWWDDMKLLADAEVGKGGDDYNITATVTRKDGGLATLDVRKVELHDPSADDPEDDPGSEDNPGESRENPQYTMRVSMEPAPLLTHPTYESIPPDPLEALRALINGATRATEIEMKNDQGETYWPTVEDILNGWMSDPVVSDARYKIQHGTDSYLNSNIQLEARYRVKDLTKFKYILSGVIATPPGPFPKPPGARNWLFAGQSVEHTGKIIWISETYILSGPYGWDPNIYSASTNA